MKYLTGKLTKSRLIVSDQIDTLNIYDLVDHEIFFVKEIKFGFGKDEYFRTFEFIENENLLLIGKKNGVVQFIDLTTERVLREIKLPLSNEYYLDWNLDILRLSKDENWLVVGQTWYTAYPVNLKTFESIEVSIPAQPLKIKYSFDNKYVSMIHGEQGGQGLVVYSQSEKGEWKEIYEDWAITGFEFSPDENIIYHFGLKDEVGVLKKVHLSNSVWTEWKVFFSLKELGDENIHNYGFGLHSIVNQGKDLEFSINNKTFILSALTGEVISTKTNDYKIIDVLRNEQIRVILTGEKMIVEKI